MGWYFSSEKPQYSIEPPTDGWTCIFTYLKEAAHGNKICFSESKDKKHPKATVGGLDPAMRKHILADIILFAVPANRFCNMAMNLWESFACEKSWLDLINRKFA